MKTILRFYDHTKTTSFYSILKLCSIIPDVEMLRKTLQCLVVIREDDVNSFSLISDCKNIVVRFAKVALDLAGA